MSDSNVKKITSLSKLEISFWQKVLGAFLIVGLTANGLIDFKSFQTSIKESSIFSDGESTASSLMVLQRESLVYVYRLSQWSYGEISRFELQISRALLAQRLSVVDSEGIVLGSRIDKRFLSHIQKSDAVVASTLPGILPENLREGVRSQLTPLINGVTEGARTLTALYHKNLDAKIILLAKEYQSEVTRSYYLLALYFLILMIFLAWIARTNNRRYSEIIEVIGKEQEQILSAKKELEKAEIRNRELISLDEAKDLFVSTVNHELRTPLTSIIGYVELLKAQTTPDMDPSTASYLEVLERNSNILLNLVESMLSLSRMESHSKISEVRVDLAQVLESALFVLLPKFEEANLRAVLLSSPEETFYVQGDAGHLSQAVVNVLSNAAKFSPENSEVKISLSHSDRSDKSKNIRLEIQDFGIGIPKADQKLLFTRFFRAKNAVDKQIQGTGLGLSIVERIMSLHGGEIVVESEEGIGTTITLVLPEYISAGDRMISERRIDVLRKAIVDLEETTLSQLGIATHEMGGALGFYSFPEASSSLLEFSRSLELDGTSDVIAIETQRAGLIAILKSSLETAEEMVSS